MEKLKKSKNTNKLILINVQNNNFDRPLST